MQNQEKFLEILKNPYELDKGSLSFLRKMTEAHPYSQSLQILLAKNLQQKDKLDFEQQVNKASAYAVHRRKFQRFISDRDKPEPVKTQTISQEITSSPQVSTATETIKTDFQEDSLITGENVENVSSPEVSSKEKPNQESLLEIVKRRLREIGQKNESSQKDKSDGIPAEKINDEIWAEPADKPLEAESKKYFKEDETQVNLNRASLDEVLYGSRMKKQDINYLIEKFLKEEPRIQPGKDLEDNQEDLSADSVSEAADIATETLANVYLSQGKKDEALEVYEKLCLKFPEKSSYFAKKILEIKNEINH
ncbi:MAG: hypothetical protein EA393_03205 [Bacteroidetes bacterium]|nr:MAG: hypothetical protein EA393_03205 [Bacteroidota bacterium]